MLPFIKIPFLDAPPIPPKKLSGTETTRAQGQDTTKKDNALYPQVARSLCNIAVGITNINNAKIITIGVYTFANFVMNFSVVAFFSPAFSTKSKILLSVDSWNSFVTFISSTPFVFITPLNISEFSATFLGTDSPVKADVSIKASPFVTIPSSGTPFSWFYYNYIPNFYFFWSFFYNFCSTFYICFIWF